MKAYKYIALLSICCLNTITAQTESQNYVKITQYIEPVKQINTTTAKQRKQIVYYDGLGRPIQEVNVGISPTKKSIVKYTEYDLNIGQTKDFLSYPATNGTAEYGIDAKSETIIYYSTLKYENTSNPYSEVLYERSPLKKILKKGAPGDDWKINGNHNVNFNYRLNTGNEVRYKRAKATLNTTTGIYNVSIEDKKYYSSNTLYVTTISDENGNIVEEFKDQEDRIVLKRVYNKIEDAPKMFGMAASSLNNNVLPSSQGILGDELNGKSIQDVIDNFREIVDNLEKNAINKVKKLEQETSNISSRAIIIKPEDGGGDGGGGGFNPGEVKANDINVFDTYYIYDQYGNLTLVTSPLMNGNIEGTAKDQLGYQYRYDSKNRLVSKKIPGKAWEYMVYDKADRLVAIGPVYDPFGTEAKGWIVTKYDALSRLIYSGFYSGITVSDDGFKTFQTNVNNNTISFEKRVEAISVDGFSLGYTNNGFPKDGLALLSVNYYDDYTYPNAPTNRAIIIEGQSVISNVKGLSTGSWTRVLTNRNEQKTNTSYILYDYNSRVLKSYTKNYLGGYIEVDTKYTFTGLPLKVITKHQKDTSTPLVTVLEEFVYDHAERLLHQTHKVNSLAEVVLLENVYDELGALEKKRVGGKRSGTTPTANTFLQELQYKYNIRGWLTEVNNTNNLGQLNNGKRSLFAMKLNYNKPEESIAGVKALYNGNITEQIWTSGIDNKKRSYGYVYDGVNRLVLGSFKAPDLGSASTANLYDEKLAYDKNGNITKLMRTGASLAGKSTLIDDLTYTYESGTNKIGTINDSSGNLEGFAKGNTNSSLGDYRYDEFGNLIADRNKKITSIKYNHLNLPIEISFSTDKIQYIYTSSGEKVQKKVTDKGVVTLTDYLGGFQYVKGKLSFLPTAEGFFNTETNTYVYQFKDHLGNVRLSYSDKNGDNEIQSSSEIIEETNYYPFGLAHSGYNQKNDVLMKDYKYQYNGKEKQEELGLNFYDYGARNYDAAIGRWMNVDPLAEKYMSFTPYAYVGNRPLIAVDPDGRVIEYVQKEGQSRKEFREMKREFRKRNNELSKDSKTHKDNFRQLKKSSNVHQISFSRGGGSETTTIGDVDRNNGNGSVININLNQKGNENEFVLSHEIAHSVDIDKGVNSPIELPLMSFNENSFQAIQKVFETNNINSEINESNASHIENIVRGETSISRGRIIPLRETYDLNLEYMNPFTKKPYIKKKTINVKKVGYEYYK